MLAFAYFYVKEHSPSSAFGGENHKQIDSAVYVLIRVMCFVTPTPSSAEVTVTKTVTKNKPAPSAYGRLSVIQSS